MTNLLFIIGISISTIGFVVFLSLYFINNKKHKLEINNLNTNLETIKSNNNSLIKRIKDIKDNIISTNRFGFYDGVLNLVSKEDKQKGLNGEPYDYRIYVKEIDRFTNGMSKIELISIEVINGYDISNYEWVKKSQQRRFSSLKNTNDIQWLESEESLKELRKEKLNKILNEK